MYHLVKLVLELDPVESQRVQKRREQLHAADDGRRNDQPDAKAKEERQRAPQRARRRAGLWVV